MRGVRRDGKRKKLLRIIIIFFGRLNRTRRLTVRWVFSLIRRGGSTGEAQSHGGDFRHEKVEEI